MNDPASFTNLSNRHGLPYLFSGQAQKEFTVNEAIARIDFLLHPNIVDRRTAEPAEPVAGECFIVASPASGEFQGREDQIAGWDGQQWTFLAPVAGMIVRNQSDGSLVRYQNGWQATRDIADPAGGSTIDTEARDAIAALLTSLREFGIVS